MLPYIWMRNVLLMMDKRDTKDYIMYVQKQYWNTGKNELGNIYFIRWTSENSKARTIRIHICT